MVGFEAHFFFMEQDKIFSGMAEEYFRDNEYKIIEIKLRGERGTRVLEIFVDNKGGVNIDDLAKINRDLNEMIENKLAGEDLSRLVISSPGAESPVKFIWQLYKHIGRELDIELKSGESVEGKLERILEENNSIVIAISKKDKHKADMKIEREINFEDVSRLNVKISFSKNKL